MKSRKVQNTAQSTKMADGIYSKIGGNSWGGSGLFYYREKGWAKRDFHDGWGWVIVCFVKNHTHYNSCGRFK